jgi:hypothetical protein
MHIKEEEQAKVVPNQRIIKKVTKAKKKSAYCCGLY